MKYAINNLGFDNTRIVRTYGKMNGADYIEMAKDLLKGKDCFPGGNAIFDHRELDFTGIVLKDLEQIRSFHVANEEKIGGGKTAILLKSGMIEEWNKLWSQGKKIKTNNKTKLFENYEQAEAWINEKD